MRGTAGNRTTEVLKALKETYLTHRQVGASEAAYKINRNLKLKDSNIAWVFVMTGFPEKRSYFFTKVNDVENDNNDREKDGSDSENDEETVEQKPPPSTTVKIDGRPGLYKQSVTVIDRYINRPNHLEGMCLGQFATSYVYLSTIPKRISFDDDGCSNEFSEERVFNSETILPKYISLKEKHGKMRLRSFPAVMRIHNSKKKNGHERQYSELQLFTAWRDENLFYSKDFERCIQVYQEKLDEIQQNKDKIYPGEGTTDLLENFDMETNRPVHVMTHWITRGNRMKKII